MARRAVILAGGRGRRLAPYTTVLPKPLLPLGDRPILDVVVRQLHAAGFDELVMAVGHLSHLIRALFGDGVRHGIPIVYHDEETPLGTAGPLKDMRGLDETFLMMNGDVLTSLDYRALMTAHSEAGNALTIATHRRVVETDYGILRTDGQAGKTERVTAYEEKPTLEYTVSMGVYVLEPETVEHIPHGRAFDLPELVLALLEAGRPVGSYLHEGYWLDIGRPDDYARAAEEFEQVLPQLLPEEAQP